MPGPQVGQPNLSICHICEIAILPGTDHTTVPGHFKAIKQFVKLLQDDLEESRMEGFQHPTRQELISALLEMQAQFKKLVTYEDALVDHIGKLLRGTV